MSHHDPAPLERRCTEDSPVLQKLETLAGRLLEAREKCGLSQEQVAMKIEATTRSLTRWENGECDPGFATVWSMAEIYGVSLDWLAGRSPVRSALMPGEVLLDEDVLDKVKELVEKKQSLRDVPQEMVRHPGIDYAFAIPKRARVLPIAEALRVEAEVQQLISRLSKGGR